MTWIDMACLMIGVCGATVVVVSFLEVLSLQARLYGLIAALRQPQQQPPQD